MDFKKISEAWDRRTVLAKLFSFAVIGFVNLAVDVSVFTVSLRLLHLPLVASNVVAWLIAVSTSYMLNAKITFQRETGGRYNLAEHVRFAASGVLGMVVSTAVLAVLSQYTNIPIAKLASIGGSFVANFSMSHFLVFNNPELGHVSEEEARSYAKE